MEENKLQSLLLSTKEYTFKTDRINTVLNELAGINEINSNNIARVKRLLNVVKAEKNDLIRQTQGNSLKARAWSVVGLIITIFLEFYSKVLDKVFNPNVSEFIFNIMLAMTMILILIIAYLGFKDIIGSAKTNEEIRNIELLQFNLEDLINEENAKQDK